MIPLHHGSDDTAPFPPHLPAPDGRLHGGRLACVVGVIGLCLVALVGYRLFSKEAKHDEVLPAPLPTESEVAPGGEPVPDRSLNLPQGYAGWDRRPQAPPPIPEAQRIPAPGAEPPLVRGQQIPTATAVPAAGGAPGQRDPQPRQPSGPPQPPQEKKVDHWLYGKKINEAGTSPFPDEKKDLGIPGEPPKKKGSGLLKDAEWVRPADVTRVLYKTQFLPAMTLQRIVSDIPGPVRLLVTRNVMDRWQHHVLIPQQSLLIGEQSGKPAFGESRLAFTVSEVHFPDGVILELGKAKLSDQSGQQGLTGQVDAHIPSLLLATGLSAVLNIGARSAVSGNGNQFRPSVEEDAVREAGQDAQQTAKGLIDRTLRRPPTITIKEGQEVTVQFSDNLSLAASPRIVK